MAFKALHRKQWDNRSLVSKHCNCNQSIINVYYNITTNHTEMTQLTGQSSTYYTADKSSSSSSSPVPLKLRPNGAIQIYYYYYYYYYHHHHHWKVQRGITDKVTARSTKTCTMYLRLATMKKL